MRLAKYLLALALTFAPMSVLANTVTIPNTFQNGQFIDANLFNQNFQSIATFANGNIDNTNIGVAGVYGSQIKPTSVSQAAFGGTVVYTFPAGLNINGAVLQANSGLTVVGTTNLAATVFSVPPTMSGANINANTIPNGALVTTPLTGLTAGTNISITGTAPNLTISAAGGVASVTASGNVVSSGGLTPNITLVNSPTFTGGSFSTPVTVSAGHIPPVYTATGADGGNTVHIVIGIGTFTTASTSINLNFTGAAVFTSGTSYACTANGVNANQPFTFNQSPGTAGGTTTTFNTTVAFNGSIPFACIGS